jgi:tetratricopeptide (TPR) repeat protein
MYIFDNQVVTHRFSFITQHYPNFYSISIITHFFSTMTTLLKQVFFLLIAVLFVQAATAQTREDGFAAMQMEKWDKAIEIYSALTKAKPDDQDAWLSLSNAYMAKGDKTQAIAVLRKGFEAKPEGNLAFVINARTLLFEGKSAEAEEQFKRAASKGKKDVNVLRHIGESHLFYIAPGDTKPNRVRATELLKNAFDVNGKDFNTLMSLGYAYREQSNGGEAARNFEYASQYAPKNPLPLYMLATVYRIAKLNDRFLQNLDAAIALDNGYTPALRAKADHLYFRRKFSAAKDAYAELLAKGREVVIEDEMQYANTLFLTEDYPGTADLVEKIIKKDGSKSYLRRLLGYSYYENREYDKAQTTMDEYFSIVAPETTIARDYIYKGRLDALVKKDTASAITNLRKAMEKDTAEWPLQEEIANLYYAQRNWCEASKALQVLQDSLRGDATSSNFYKLGYCYYFCKTDSMRYENALRNFQRVTEMSPNSPLGWNWGGKSAAKLDPDISVDTTAAAKAKFGKALPYFEKYTEIAEAEIAKGTTTLAKAKKDMTAAYGYIIYYYYAAKRDDAKCRAAIAKMLVIDPADPTAIGIQNELNGGGVAPPPAPK